MCGEATICSDLLRVGDGELLTLGNENCHRIRRILAAGCLLRTWIQFHALVSGVQNGLFIRLIDAVGASDH